MARGIFESSEKGLLSFLKGRASAFVARPGIYEEVPEMLMASEGLYLEGDFIAQLTFKGYRLIYPSVTAQSDLFYITNGNTIKFDYDYISFARDYRDILTVDKEAEDYFIKHSLHRPGETFHKEIKRVLIGDGIVIYDDGTYEMVSLPVKKWNVISEDFFDGLRAFCAQQNPIDEKEYLLFSGGRDSALLALTLAKELGKKMHYLTSVPKKFYDGGDYSEKFDVYSGILGVEIEQVSLDYDLYTWDNISYLVPKMPLAAHISVAFDLMNRYVDQYDGRPWTGQDADSMYCLGYSGDGYLEMMERFFISDGYLKSLDDVVGTSLGGIIGRIIAWGGSRKTGKPLCAPRNIGELKDCVVNMYSTVPILDVNHKCEAMQDHKISLTEARNILWNNKISMYITARDHRSMAYAGECKKATVFPYSSAMMYFFQINMRRGFTEIIANKKLISHRIEYYIGKDRFKKLYPNDFWMRNRVSMNYEESILMNSAFGKSLRETSRCDGKILSQVLAKCWMNEVFRLINAD